MCITKNNYHRPKLPKLSLNALELYLGKALRLTNSGKVILPRNFSMSNSFRPIQAYTPQGRVNVRIQLNKFKVGFKLGMFAATKKPFNFRPKVKKQKR